MTKKTDTPDNPDHLDADTFSLTDWVAGIVPTVRSVKLYGRGDLLEQIDEIQARIRVARQIPAEDRGINDETPESLNAAFEELALVFDKSGRTFKVQGRSAASRDAIEKKVRTDNEDATDNDVFLAQLADQVIEPAGVTADVLRVLSDQSEPQLVLLANAARSANSEAPRVTLPFSSRSSGGRNGRTA